MTYKLIKKTLLCLVIGALLSICENTFAQSGPPAPPSTGHGTTSNFQAPAQSGGGAPMEEGTYMLVLLAGTYGAFRYYKIKRDLAK